MKYIFHNNNYLVNILRLYFFFRKYKWSILQMYFFFGKYILSILEVYFKYTEFLQGRLSPLGYAFKYLYGIYCYMRKREKTYPLFNNWFVQWLYFSRWLICCLKRQGKLRSSRVPFLLKRNKCNTLRLLGRGLNQDVP